MVKIQGFKAFLANPKLVEKTVIPTEDYNIKKEEQKNELSFSRISHPAYKHKTKDTLNFNSEKRVGITSRSLLKNFINNGIYKQSK